jgi:hypothetical protein
MSPPFSIDPSARLVHCRLDGAVPAARLRECLDAVLPSPRFERGFGFVLNARGGPGLTPTRVQDLAALIRIRAPRLGPCRWAVVVDAEEGLLAVRALALLTRGSGVTVAPFTDPTQAEHWARDAHGS